MVREVISLGPADVEGSIEVWDTLVAVNGRPVAPAANLDDLLMDRAGKRTVLAVRSGALTREAVLRPVRPAVAAGLLYRQWVNERRAYVEKASGGWATSTSPT